LIDRLAFASPFVYSSRGTSTASVQSRKLRDRIKSGDEQLYRQIAEHVATLVAGGVFPGFFDGDVTLVPVPGHTPLAPGAISNTWRIANALLAQGLGADLSLMLERQRPVQKSAFSSPAARPRARDHYESMSVKPSLLKPMRILLIDDFITRGATSLGAASRILEAQPGCAVKAFGLVRSITDGEIATVRDPCVGYIELHADGETARKP
jgi:predicted amidophosphoribosyltransferase